MARIFIVTVLIILINSCAEDTGIDITKTYLNPCDYIIEDFSEINISNSNYFGTDSTLDVITWNLEQFPKHNSTVDYLLELIPILNVDIIALQEIGSETDFQNLINSLNNYDGIITNSASYNINLAFLYSNDLEVEATYEIFTDDWRSFPRPPLVAHIIWEGEDVYVINNHYKCCGNEIIEDDEDDEEYRRLQAIKYTKDYFENSLVNKNIVLVGDFNDELSDEKTNNIYWDFISDNNNYRFVDLFIACNQNADWSYPSWPSHLDHILITNELFDEFENEGSSVQTIRLEEYFDNGWTDYEKYISDHRPVGLRLKFSQ